MTVNYMYFCSEMEGQKGFRELRKIIYFTLIPASVRNISTQHIDRRYHMRHFLEVFLYSARLCDAKSVIPFPPSFFLSTNACAPSSFLPLPTSISTAYFKVRFFVCKFSQPFQTG